MSETDDYVDLFVDGRITTVRVGSDEYNEIMFASNPSNWATTGRLSQMDSVTKIVKAGYQSAENTTSPVNSDGPSGLSGDVKRFMEESRSLVRFLKDSGLSFICHKPRKPSVLVTFGMGSFETSFKYHEVIYTDSSFITVFDTRHEDYAMHPNFPFDPERSFVFKSGDVEKIVYGYCTEFQLGPFAFQLFFYD